MLTFEQAFDNLVNDTEQSVELANKVVRTWQGYDEGFIEKMKFNILAKRLAADPEKAAKIYLVTLAYLMMETSRADHYKDLCDELCKTEAEKSK